MHCARRIYVSVFCVAVTTWFNAISGRRIVCSKKGRTFKKHIKRYAELTISPPTLNLFKSLHSETPSSFFGLANDVS